MTKKTFALVLVLLLIGSCSVWAQTVNTPSVPVNTNQSSDATNGHISRGCYLCHTPHASVGLIQQASTGISQASLKYAYQGGTVPAGGALGAAVGNPFSGNIYLWGQALSPLTYTTWDGGTLSATGLMVSSPAVHSIMCLSCHDGSVTGNSHDLITGLGGAAGTGATASFGPAGGIAGSFFTGAATNNGWASSSSLVTNHPIDAPYPVQTTDAGYGLYWAVSVSGNTVTFTDTTFIPGTGESKYIGHAAKLYSNGAGAAYVECTSCHEPHRELHVAYNNGGTWIVDTAVGSGGATTEDYIRGPFLPGTNGNEAAGFCRSCHYEKSIQYVNNGGATGK